MKRLVWLLLALFVTALAQVTPVDLGSQGKKTCSCCEAASACGNRDCGLPPAACASASSTLLAEQPGQALAKATRKTAAPIYRLTINPLFQTRELMPAWNSRAIHSVSPEPVPLFKAQCSFLI